MIREQAITKAEAKARRFGRAYLVTSRTAHPAYPGETAYLTVAKADKHAWAPDEQLILDTEEDYAAGVAAGSSLPDYMTIDETRDHCHRALGL